MRVQHLIRIALAIALSAVSASGAAARSVTWKERVKAQEAIDRIYYGHLIGATQKFEEVVPRPVIEARVSDYLRKSMALEKYFNTRLTTATLDAEVQRMAGSSVMPGRLEEIFAALGNDPQTIRECLARPMLADRIARGVFGPSRVLLGSRPIPWEEWWEKTSLEFNEANFVPAPDEKADRSRRGRRLVERLDSAEGREPDDTWRSIAVDLQPSIDSPHSAVWTGTHMIVWGRDEPDGETGVGGRYDPATNSWSPVSIRNAPTSRYAHVAVWTGRQMLVWGGSDDKRTSYVNTGGRYDPLYDTWTPMSVVDAPTRRYYPTAVWTGKEMLVWGGYDLRTLFDSGGRYDPATDTWRPMSATLAPQGRWFHTAVWTGARMIVWGGYGGYPTLLGSGGSYDPATDTWSRISSRGAPTARKHHVALWTGDRMILWGGATEEIGTNPPANDGGLYDPATDSWKPMSLVRAPEGRAGPIAVWTGSQMLIWGGHGGARPGGPLESGARYSPAKDSWAPLTHDGEPPGRTQATGVWIGDGMLIWGGSRLQNSRLDTSRRDYTPSAFGGFYRASAPDRRIAENDVPPVPPAGPVPAGPGGIRPYKAPSNLLEHFRARYEQVDSESLISSLTETPDGPNGHVSLRGRMTPDNIKPWTTRDERARATAMAFLTQEAALLDLPDLGELEERQFKWFEEDRVIIDYARRIGGCELLGVNLHLEVEADGPVVTFSASLAPAGPALYAAAKGPFLSETQMIESIQNDLGPGENGKPATALIIGERYARPLHPAIIQGAIGVFNGQQCSYFLDAMTGEIAMKNCAPGLRFGRPPASKPGG
jgi:N-acetylneuraminic acid mutarotase